MISGAFAFRFQERVVYGTDFVVAAVAQIEEAGAVRAFVMTSRSMAEARSVRALEATLGARHAGTFARIRPNSPREDVIEGANLARAAGADVLIAIGGGSVVDAAKVMQLCLWNDVRAIQDLDAFRTAQGASGKERLMNALTCRPRLIAVPTLLSGAEFTHFAGVTDLATGRKEAYEHPLMVPQVAILDPALLATSPPGLVATTGARAIDHCIETFCSPQTMPFYDALAIEGLRLLWRALPSIVEGKATCDDHMNALLGAWMAIAPPASGVPVGASHAIARVVGSLHDVSHGHASAVLQAAVIRWNAREEGAAQRQRELMKRAGIAGKDLATAIADFLQAIGQPGRLSEVGVDPDAFDKIAEYSVDMLKHHSVTGNARPIERREQVLEILEIAK